MFLESACLAAHTYLDDDELDSSIFPTTDEQMEVPTLPELEDTVSRDAPVDHLIFVIHGIGQQTEKYGYFYQHIKSLQETTRQVLQARVPDHSVRIEIVPIEWHKHIHEQVDPLLNVVTLSTMPTVRLVNNDYLADILLYFSRDRQQSIINHVTHLFNSSYNQFLEKHPTFNGKVAILGYSLGGIITWDILSHQRAVSTPEELQQLATFDVNFPRLDFKPHYFFGLGCPLGGILSIRGQSPKHYHPEEDIIFENIYHLFDPVGYRVEPLLSDYYKNEPAVFIERSVPLSSLVSSFTPSNLFSFFRRRPSYDEAVPPVEDEGQDRYPTESGDCQEEDESNDDSNITDSIDPDTDHEEHKGVMSYFRSWISSYWSDDVEHNESTRSSEEEEPCIFVNQQNAHDNAFHLDTSHPLSNTNSNENDRVPCLSNTDDKCDTNNNTTSCSSSRSSSSLGCTVNSDDDDEPGTPVESMIPVVPAFDDPCNRRSVRQLRRRSRTFGSRCDLLQALADASHAHKPEQRHLVEVLGIDDVSLDSFARAESTFGKHAWQDKSTSLWDDLSNELAHPMPNIPKAAASMTTIPGSLPPEHQLPGGRRIDYMLQPDGLMSRFANEYLVGVNAHFSYWTHKDLLWHIVCHLENMNEGV